MTDRILPKERAPELSLPKLDTGEDWNLRDVQPENFTLLVFYRGHHCPLCKKQLEELNENVAKFEDLGVDVFALSCDDRSRAEKTGKSWQIDNLSVLYGFRLDEARRWGLYISKAINDDEPDYFCEPGLFLLEPDRTLYAAWIQSVPFARPPLANLLETVEFVLEKGYPPRGAATHLDIRSAA